MNFGLSAFGFHPVYNANGNSHEVSCVIETNKFKFLTQEDFSSFMSSAYDFLSS